jgi:Family of unknown function (DUF5317)
MLVVVASLLALLSVVPAGGQLTRLAEVHLRARWLPVTALGVQIVIIELVPRAPRPILVSAHLATYLLAGAFVWLNRRIPGLLVIAAGATLNGVVIAINAGTLPASAAAQRLAGISEVPGDFTNSGVLASAHLAFLGDQFAWPQPLPFANVFSVGDVLIVVGVGLAAHGICRTRPSREGLVAQGAVDG